MVDRTGRGTRPTQQRIRNLAQAALNADQTVGQLDGVITTLGATLSDLDASIKGLDHTLARFNDTIGSIDTLAERLIENGHQRANSFSMERLAASYEQLYRDAMARTAAA